MIVTLDLDDELIRKAQLLTGLADSTMLLEEALKALISSESALGLSSLGGSDEKAKAPPRRRAPRR